MNAQVAPITDLKLCTDASFLKMLYKIAGFLGFLQCFSCRRGLLPFCCTCASNIRYVATRDVGLLETAYSPLLRWKLHAAFEYTKPIKKLLVCYKYTPSLLAQYEILRLLGEYVDIDPFKRFEDSDFGYRAAQVLVLPVPMSLDKLRQRGFSPAHELAIAVARHIKKKFNCAVFVSDTLLHKKHQVDSQAHKKRKERLLTVHSLYSAAQAFAEIVTTQGYTDILLVDDVITTRATVTTLAEKISYELIQKKLYTIRCSVFSFAMVLRNTNS